MTKRDMHACTIPYHTLQIMKMSSLSLVYYSDLLHIYSIQSLHPQPSQSPSGGNGKNLQQRGPSIRRVSTSNQHQRHGGTRFFLSFHRFIIIIIIIILLQTTTTVLAFVDQNDIPRYNNNQEDDRISSLADDSAVFHDALSSLEFVDEHVQNVNTVVLYKSLDSFGTNTEVHSLTDNGNHNGNGNNGISMLEETASNLGLSSPSHVQIDVRSGKVSSLLLSTPLLPSKPGAAGHGNGLLWMVDILQQQSEMGEDIPVDGIPLDDNESSFTSYLHNDIVLDGEEKMVPDIELDTADREDDVKTAENYEISTEQWEQYATEAIHGWTSLHSRDLGIDVAELFSSEETRASASSTPSNTRSSSSSSSSYYASNDNVHMLRDEDDGDAANGKSSHYQQQESPPTSFPKNVKGSIQTAIHDSGNLLQLYLPRTYMGVPVLNSFALASIQNGNLVYFGLEHWSDIDTTLDVRPTLELEEIWGILSDYIGDRWKSSMDDTSINAVNLWCKPELHVLVTSLSMSKMTVDIELDQPDNGDRKKKRGLLRGLITDENDINNSNGEQQQQQNGYDHHLIYRLCPHFSTTQKYEVQIDAHTGTIRSFVNKIDYAFQVTGSVYPMSNDGIYPDGILQQATPMPFMNVLVTPIDENGNEKKKRRVMYTTNQSGQLPYLSEQEANAMAKLEGPYVQINDQCGVSELNGRVWGGGLDWGGGDGESDCEYIFWEVGAPKNVMHALFLV